MSDTDRDGILDPVDRCVEQPETRNNFQDEDGCPDDPDPDRDGVLGADDRCPNEPEDRDSHDDADGCPDPDNDGDGIADTLDRCPGERETPNGFEDGDGCPDEAPPTAQVVDNRITINQVVMFERNSGRLRPVSSAILNEVARVMREHPEIARIRVEGHADDTGSEARNAALALKRAKSVAKYLQRAGIARSRLAFEGFGSTRPLDRSGTEEAHARNRRVEFVIEGAQAPGATFAPAAQTRRAPRGGRR